MDLRLLNKLQGADTVTLVLRASAGEMLEYFIIAQTVAYAVICSGYCSGTIRGEMACFNIRMSSVTPLIERNFKLVIRYEQGELKFVTEDEGVEIRPLCVEYHDANADRVVEKYLRFVKAVSDRESSEERIEALENDIAQLSSQHNSLSLMQLSGGPSENPFTEDTSMQRIDNEFRPKIEAKRKQLLELQRKDFGVTELDMSAFCDIIGVAAKTHEVVNFCETYAIAEVGTGYLLQKADCPVMSLPGPLTNILIKDGEGKGFYQFEDELVYLHGVKEKTVVFITKYLPNNEVDSSIVTRGVVQEKYTIKIKGILDIAAIVRSKFPKFTMDMGAGVFILSNDNGERITSKFDVEDVKTLQLSRKMRGENVGSITMATIDIPKSILGVLGLFKNSLTIYVRNNKVVFQNGGLYLVFNR